MLNSLGAIVLPLDLNFTILSIRIRRQHQLFLFVLNEPTSRLFGDHGAKRLEEVFDIASNFLTKLDNLNCLAILTLLFTNTLRKKVDQRLPLYIILLPLSQIWLVHSVVFFLSKQGSVTRVLRYVTIRCH